MMTSGRVSAELCGVIAGEGMETYRPVTVEEKKKWLKQVSRAVEELADLYDAREKELGRVSSTTASYSSVVVGGSKSPHKFDEISFTSVLISQKEREIKKRKEETMRAILTVRSREQRSVLTELYINCRSISETAEELSYSERHVKRLHKDGISNIRITRRMIEKNSENAACSPIKQ